jgi:hypothetical protein
MKPARYVAALMKIAHISLCIVSSRRWFGVGSRSSRRKISLPQRGFPKHWTMVARGETKGTKESEAWFWYYLHTGTLEVMEGEKRMYFSAGVQWSWSRLRTDFRWHQNLEGSWLYFDLLNPLVLSLGEFSLYLSFWPFFAVGYLSRLWPMPVGSV